MLLSLIKFSVRKEISNIRSFVDWQFSTPPIKHDFVTFTEAADGNETLSVGSEA